VELRGDQPEEVDEPHEQQEHGDRHEPLCHALVPPEQQDEERHREMRDDEN